LPGGLESVSIVGFRLPPGLALSIVGLVGLLSPAIMGTDRS